MEREFLPAAATALGRKVSFSIMPTAEILSVRSFFQFLIKKYLNSFRFSLGI